MCGVVGCFLENPSPEQLQFVKDVLLQSEIRGKHASGVAWYDNGLHCIKKPVPISALIKELDFSSFISDNRLTLIGHVRYSTSDLEYNQPIGDEKMYMVHNGVVTQSEPETWYEKYGYRCSGKNDSELLWHHLNVLPWDYINAKFPKISYSAITINQFGRLTHGRNGLRPQWRAEFENGSVIASTKDILVRAGADKLDCVIGKVKSDSYDEQQERNFEQNRRIYNPLQK